MAPRRRRITRKSRRYIKPNSHGRKYADCRPQAPCAESDGRRHGGTIGGVVSGFDHYGYPVVRNMSLPAPFGIKDGRKYGAAESMIRPMRLVAVGPDGTPPPPKPGIAKVGVFKLKPSPSVPAAPDSLPSKYKFCVQKGEHGYFYRFRNAKTSLHGSEAEVLGCEPDDTGLVLCMVKMPGSDRPQEAPLCEDDPGADKEPVPVDCCVKLLGDTSGQIICPGSSYDLLIVEVGPTGTSGGIQFAAVKHPDIPGGVVKLPVCEPIDEEPEARPCCIEETTGLIICPKGVDFPLNGKKIPLDFLEFSTESDGMRVARLKCGDVMAIDPSARAGDPTLDAMWVICEELGGYIFPVCERKPERPKLPPPVIRTPPPPRVPDICCYDPQTGTLVCEGTRYNNLPVNVVSEAVVGGKSIVSVASERLPGGGARVPLCPTPPDIPKLPPADCCVVESSSGLVLMCAPQDHPWHNKDVSSFGHCVDTPNGRVCVLAWADEYGEHVLELPACPPHEAPPPPPGSGTAPPPKPVPSLPPVTRPPADECDTTEGNRCREKWDEMVSKPAKMTKCDKKWLNLVKRIRENKCGGPGRRASMLDNHRAKSRRYAMGIAPENREYGRFPGLRGGRNMV